MSLGHIFLALLVTAIWGLNFVVIKVALYDISPLTLCLLRFILAALPALLIARPKVPMAKLSTYALFTFILQFTLLFSAMQIGISAGLASLLLQTQVFFTLLLAILLYHERPTGWQSLGAALAFGGILLLMQHIGMELRLLSFILVLLAALAWAAGNLVAKSMGKVSMLPVVIWASAYSCPPLMLLTLWQQGASVTVQQITQMGSASALAIVYITVLSTLVGYGCWNKLLSQYSVITIAPFTLLVPVFGMLSSALLLGEIVPRWKVQAFVLIILGLCCHVLSAKRTKKLKLTS